MANLKAELLQKDTEAYFRAVADLKAGLVELTPEVASRAIIDFAIAAREADPKMNGDRFSEILREYGVTIRAQARLSVPEGSGNGTVVRAACRSGIVTGLDEKDVGDMLPWQVNELANGIVTVLNASFAIPKA